MPDSSKQVEAFVSEVQRRKNRHRLWTTLLWTVAVGAIGSIGVGLFYILQGYAAPGLWIGGIFAVVAAVAGSIWAVRRWDVERTARFTDRFFQLQDTVSSYLHFSARGRREGYYALQARQTAKRISELDPTEVRYRPSRRLLVLSLGLLAVVVPIGLCPPSDAVLKRLAAEEAVAQETALTKDQLLREIDQLIDEAKDKEEQNILEQEKLRRWVKELKATKDHTEALRQLARLEKKLNGFRQSLQRQKDEKLLERAAVELSKAEETKPMSDILKKKDFDKAAKMLKDLKPHKMKSKDQMKRDLARLKAIAQRMAAANKTSKHCKNSKCQGKPGDKSGQECKNPCDGDLADAIEELDEAIEELEKMEECELQECDLQECDGCCQKVDRLGDELKKLALCRRTDARLKKLCRRCGQCQNKVCAACQSPNAGGKKAGWGTNASRREQRDPLADNQQYTKLKGIKGSGPSLMAVESADSGTGVSHRRSTVRQREFRHQCESFVQREDVPEAVRDGVKQYFEIIHEADTDHSSPQKSTSE